MTTPSEVLTPKKAETYIPRKYAERPHLIFEGLYASDKAWMDAVVDLRTEYESIPIDALTAGAYTGLGVTDEFSRLGSIPGIAMQPGGIAPYDAYSRYGGERVPNVAWSVLDALLDLLVPTTLSTLPITINKYSSIGPPTLAKDMPTKVKEAYAWAETCGARLKLIRAGALKELYQSHGIIFCGTNGERHQHPKVEKLGSGYTVKPREAWTFDGTWEDVDWTPPEPWLSANPMFKRCRRRVINVTPMSAYPLRYLAHNIMKHMKRVAAFAFDHRDPASMSRKVRGYRAMRFFDAKNHDWHIHPWFLKQLTAKIGERLGWTWASLTIMVLRQAQLVKPDRLGQGGARLDGDPFDIGTFRAMYGNPSGIPLTSVIAYLAGIWYGLTALVLTGQLRPERTAISALLNGANKDWALMNAGDNLCVAGPSDELIAALPASITFAELSESDSFLGQLPIRKGGIVSFVPNICSYVNNLLMPGRSLDDPQRGDPILGAAARRVLFAMAPAFDRVDGVLQRVLKDRCHIDYAAVQSAGARKAAAMDFVTAMLHYNPDVIHYRVDPMDVDPRALEDYFILIPEDVGSRIIKAFAAENGDPWRRLYETLTSDYTAQTSGGNANVQ
jgi:hypothetical protein